VKDHAEGTITGDQQLRWKRAGERLGVFGAHLHRYGTVTSTNDVVAALAGEGAPHGTVVVAKRQTAGRGRHGNDWFSPFETGLYVSVLLRRMTSPVLPLAAGVAVADTLRHTANLEVWLEWPNDVVAVTAAGESRKVAGILTEATTVDGKLARVVVGIGINLREASWPAALVARAGSVEGVTGTCVDRDEVLIQLLAALSARCDDLECGGVADLLQRWESLAPSSNGTMVEWSVGSTRRRGVTEGLNEDGALIVRVGTGYECLVGGEVRQVRSWLDTP